MQSWNQEENEFKAFEKPVKRFGERSTSIFKEVGKNQDRFSRMSTMMSILAFFILAGAGMYVWSSQNKRITDNTIAEESNENEEKN